MASSEMSPCEVCKQPYGTQHSGPGQGSKHAVTYTACCHTPLVSHPHGPPCCEHVERALDDGKNLQAAIAHACSIQRRDDAGDPAAQERSL